MFEVHKPGQAKLSRTIALLGGLFLIVWGCRSLVYELPSLWKVLGDAWNEILSGARPDEGWRVDLIVAETKFSLAATIALLAAIVGGFAWFRLLNRPKIADHLVDMESELRKVSWPSFADAWQSTLVVSGFTALIVVLVFVYDLTIKFVIDLMPTKAV